MVKLPLFDMIKKDPKKLTIVIVASAAALVFLFVYFLLIPQIAKFGAAMGKYSKARIELKFAKEEIAKIDKYKVEIEKSREKIDLYEKKLPAEQEMPSILENLDSMAKRSRLDILAITPVSSSATLTEAGQKATYQEFLIRISLRCGYHELGRLLSAMENADRFMKIVDIDIKGDEKTPKKHSVDLVVATYILLKDKAANAKEK